MFRPPIVAIFGEVFFEGNSRWLKYVGGYADHYKSTSLSTFLVLISHKKLSVHGHEKFKID